MKFISVIHREISDKIDLLQQIAEVVDPPVKDDCQKLYRKYNLETIETRCLHGAAVALLVQYEITARYVEILSTINLVQEITAIRNILAKKITVKTACEKLLRACDDIIIDIEPKKQDYKTCPECSSRMVVREHKNDIVCTKCSYSINLCGIISEEKGGVESQPKRNGNSETMKHLKKQFELLFAHIQPVLPESEYASISAWLSSNIEKHITEAVAENYRLCLKKLNLTKLNMYIPYLMKRCSKTVITDLTYDQNNRFWAIAEKVVGVLDKISGNSDDKLKYYIYIIVKILEIILDNTTPTLRQIKQCAYLKSTKTTIRQDQIWEKVCSQLGIAFNKTQQ